MTMTMTQATQSLNDTNECQQAIKIDDESGVEPLNPFFKTKIQLDIVLPLPPIK